MSAPDADIEPKTTPTRVTRSFVVRSLIAIGIYTAFIILILADWPMDMMGRLLYGCAIAAALPFGLLECLALFRRDAGSVDVLQECYPAITLAFFGVALILFLALVAAKTPVFLWFFLSLLYSFFSLWSAIQLRRRHDALEDEPPSMSPLCSHCGYNLIGSIRGHQLRCPECDALIPYEMIGFYLPSDSDDSHANHPD